MRLVFWEPIPSPHKGDFFEALQRSPAVDSVLTVADEGLYPKLKEQGWRLSESSVPCVVGPSQDDIRDIVAEAPGDSIHVFSGLRRIPTIVEGLRRVREQGCRFGLMSEPRVLDGVSGKLRLLQSWATESKLRQHADFVLGIGAHGPSWFRIAGFPKAKIFPFAYFVASPSVTPGSEIASVSPTIRVAFLGRLVKAKGIHLLLDALPFLNANVELHVAGSGAESERVRSNPSIVFHGVIDMATVGDYLSSMDILVLPSITTDDGWGVVISEALLCGSAVVASSKVGASSCLDGDVRGRVFQSLDGRALANEIQWLIDNGRLTPAYRQKRKKWAQERLTGSDGAAYFLKIMEHVYNNGARPSPFYE